LRDRINKSRLLERCTADIKKLLHYEEFVADGSGEDEDWAGLQTDGDRVLDGGRTYGEDRSGDCHRPHQLPGRPARLPHPASSWGPPSTRGRDVLWDEIRTYSGQGRAVLAHTTDNEQGFSFRTRDHAWHPTDHEGLTLLHRPAPLRPVPRRLVPHPLAARHGRGGARPQSAGSSAGECRMAGGTGGAPDTVLGEGSPR
jgi:hypothetical protein